MIHAYDEVLLNNAGDSLGRMLDFAEHSLHIGADSMLSLFIASDVASEFERYLLLPVLPRNSSAEASE